MSWRTVSIPLTGIGNAYAALPPDTYERIWEIRRGQHARQCVLSRSAV